MIYPLLPYLILLATCAPGFHLLPPNLQIFYTMVSSTRWTAFGCEATPTQEHCPLILAEAPNLIGFTRFAITTCSHKVHSWGAAVCGHWPSPKVTNWCSLCPCRSHTSAALKARAVPLWTLLGRTLKTCAFFPKNLLSISGDFHTFGPFSEKDCRFSSKWNCLWRKNASLALKWLMAKVRFCIAVSVFQRKHVLLHNLK